MGKTLLAIVMIASLASCATSGRYTAAEYYYTQDGVYWSCREPRPYLGGNCKPETDWEDKNVTL